MVTNYKRKTPKKDPNQYVRALRAIAEGMHIRAAARDFGVTERSLRRHLSNNPDIRQANPRLARATSNSTTPQPIQITSNDSQPIEIE